MLKTLPELMKEVNANIRRLDSESAYREAKENKGLLIDVREPAETTNEKVAESINIPRGLVEIKVPEIAADPAVPIYIHCATGGRACLAAEQLQRLGYTHVTAITCPASTVIENWS